MKSPYVRDFSRFGDAIAVPDLIRIQTESYARFLQEDSDSAKRENRGLEALLYETAPRDPATARLGNPGRQRR